MGGSSNDKIFHVLSRNAYFGSDQQPTILEYRISSFKKFEFELYGRVLYIRGVFADILVDKQEIQFFIDSSLRRDKKDILQVGNIIKATGVYTYSSQKKLIFAVHKWETIVRSTTPLKQDSENEKLNSLIHALRNSKTRKKLLNSNTFPLLIENYLRESGYTSIITSPIITMDTGTHVKPMYIRGTKKQLRTDFEIETRAYLLLHQKVYQIGHVYRNEGVSHKNRQEFIYGNVYQAYTSLEKTKDSCKLLLSFLSSKVGFTLPLINEITFNKFISDVIENNKKNHTLRKIIKNNLDINKRNIEIYKHLAKKSVTEPILIDGYPSCELPFAKTKKDNKEIAEDFRILWKGRTVIHGSLEINEYEEQNQRYIDLYGQKYMQKISQGERTYLELLSYGIPPFCGYSISVDLLTQLLVGEDDVNNLRPTII